MVRTKLGEDGLEHGLLRPESERGLPVGELVKKAEVRRIKACEMCWDG